MKTLPWESGPSPYGRAPAAQERHWIEIRDGREVDPIPLRERLPVNRVPLRPTDADVMLELQPLIDPCHQRGRSHLKGPPFAGATRSLKVARVNDSVWT